LKKGFVLFIDLLFAMAILIIGLVILTHRPFIDKPANDELKETTLKTANLLMNAKISDLCPVGHTIEEVNETCTRGAGNACNQLVRESLNQCQVLNLGTPLINLMAIHVDNNKKSEATKMMKALIEDYQIINDDRVGIIVTFVD